MDVEKWLTLSNRLRHHWCISWFERALASCCVHSLVGVRANQPTACHFLPLMMISRFLATMVVAMTASVRKFHQIGWLTWAGFISIFVAVFIVVVAVTTRDRPAAAPATGDYELGYYVVPSGVTFAAGVVASTTIFVSSAGTSAFLPVISEMRNPKDYRKALFVCMGIVTSAYLAFSLVVYRWCGQWVASPSLGSAGQTVKMVAYGVGLIGLIVSACLYLHVAAKYVFVRILRGSKHLQANTFVHWATWLSCTFGLAALAFVLAEAIPIFNYLIALTGSVCFAPLAIALPGWLWIHDHKDWMRGSALKQVAFWFHAMLIPLGFFFLVGGTYGVIKEIIAAYADGQIGELVLPLFVVECQANVRRQARHFRARTTPTLLDQWLICREASNEISNRRTYCRLRSVLALLNLLKSAPTLERPVSLRHCLREPRSIQI